MARARGMEAKGYTYSCDMLREAAMTAADAARYARAYADAIFATSTACDGDGDGDGDESTANPGISVKLSALHPRYKVAKTDRVMAELVPELTGLARQAAQAGMGLNIDAEEADRLGLSLKVIEAVLADPALAGWDGFGVVVHAHRRRTGDVVDGLYRMAERHDRRIMAVSSRATPVTPRSSTRRPRGWTTSWSSHANPPATSAPSRWRASSLG